MEFTKDQICREGIVWQATKYLGETLTLFPQLFGMSSSNDDSDPQNLMMLQHTSASTHLRANKKETVHNPTALYTQGMISQITLIHTLGLTIVQSFPSAACENDLRNQQRA